MDYQNLFNAAVGLCGGLGAFLLSVIWSKLDGLQKRSEELADKLSSVEVLVAGRYVTREEFSNACNILFAKLDSIAEKLGGKADR